MIKERCWFSQIDFFVSYFPHRINILFLSSQCHPHTLIRIILFHGVRTFSQAYFNRFFSNCLSHDSRREADRTDVVPCDAEDPCSVKLHKMQNHLSQCLLGVQLDLFIFGALSPIRHSSNDRGPLMKRGVLFFLLFLLHQSRQIFSDSCFVSRRNLFKFSHYFSTVAFAAGIFIA